MSEDNKSQHEATNPPLYVKRNELDFNELHEARTVDADLQMQVKLSHIGIERGITLLIGGTLVTGTLISASRYFEMTAIDYERKDGEPENNIFANTIRDRAKRIQKTFELQSEVEPADDEVDVGPSYIHLKNAHYVTGGNIIPANGSVLWRGKISSVDGFHIGRLSTS